MTRVLAIVSAILLVLVTSGCGDDSGPQVQEGPADLSPDGIAAVVADHVDRPAQEVAAWDVMTRELGVESPGASIDYGSGVALSVSVAPTSDSPFVCADESFFDACVDVTHDGHELALGWQEEVPEETRVSSTSSSVATTRTWWPATRVCPSPAIRVTRSSASRSRRWLRSSPTSGSR